MSETGGRSILADLSGQNVSFAAHRLFAGSNQEGMGFSTSSLVGRPSPSRPSFRSLLNSQEWLRDGTFTNDSPEDEGVAGMMSRKTLDVRMPDRVIGRRSSAQPRTHNEQVRSAAEPIIGLSENAALYVPGPAPTTRPVAPLPTLSEGLGPSLAQPATNFPEVRSTRLPSIEPEVQCPRPDERRRPTPDPSWQGKSSGQTPSLNPQMNPSTRMAQRQGQFFRAPEAMDSVPEVVPALDRSQVPRTSQNSDQEIQAGIPFEPAPNLSTEHPSLETSPRGLSASWHGTVGSALTPSETNVPPRNPSREVPPVPAHKPTTAVPRSLSFASENPRPADRSQQLAQAPVIHQGEAGLRVHPAIEHNSEAAQLPPPDSMRAPVGMGSMPGRTSGLAPATKPTSLDGAERNATGPFAVLDKETGALPPTWTHAGANTAEGGFQDSELGWVSVRAQRDSTGVHAVVMPASENASEALGGHLTELASYLVEHHTRVETVTVAHPQTSEIALDTTHTKEQTIGQESGQHRGSQQQTEPIEDEKKSLSDIVPGKGESQEFTEPIFSGLERSGLYVSLIA